jgi:hypothetical protein
MFRAWDSTSSSAHGRSGCAADARTLPCAGPLLPHRVLGPPERRALRRPAPGRLATADAAPASQPEGGGPVDPRVRRLVGTAVEAARPEAPSLGAVAVASARPTLGLPAPREAALRDSLLAAPAAMHLRALHTKRAAFRTRWKPTSMVMTRIAMPGGPGTQEHMYVKRSPRLMYALPDDDPGAPLLTPTPRPTPPRPASPAPIVRRSLHCALSLRPPCAQP